MPFALVFIGLVLVITGARGTMRELGEELRTDFTGPGNFVWWIASIGVVGSLGYIQELRSFSRWFMALIIVAMVLSNRGFFAKLFEALQAGPENIGSEDLTAGKNDHDIVKDALDTNLPDVVKTVDDLKGIGGTGSTIATGVGNSLSELFKRFQFI